MADFKSAITIGLQAALDAERRRTEIKTIFAEMDKQVFEATAEKVQIKVDVWDPAGINGLLRLASPSKFVPDWAILAIGVRDKSKEMLAKWEQSKDGYPCKIEIGSFVYSCEDKASLEECLSTLLKDPTVGEKLHKLMNSN